MRKHVLFALASVVITGLCWQPASAQLPGGLKIPKVSKPKPTPTPAETPQPAPSSESRPAAQPQPTSGATATTPAATGQPLNGFDKGWLVVRTLVISSYKGNYDVWSWTPVVEFRDRSGLPSGAGYYAEFTQPDGAPWVKLECEQNGETFTCIDRHDDSKGATFAGLIPFAIKLRNPLQGTEQTVFTGKAKVEKSPSSDVERNKLSYYVNHDWALPVGYVFRRPDNQLGFALWLHTDNSSGLEPHVFYNGAEVGLATLNGEYEIKVLWNKRLARSIKFTVNPDGSIKDTGIAAANGFGTDRVMVPVKLIGTQDGPWNKDAWKTEAFYGNPPQGFTPAP